MFGTKTPKAINNPAANTNMLVIIFIIIVTFIYKKYATLEVHQKWHSHLNFRISYSSPSSSFLNFLLRVKLNGTLTQHFTGCPFCKAGVN